MTWKQKERAKEIPYFLLFTLSFSKFFSKRTTNQNIHGREKKKKKFKSEIFTENSRSRKQGTHKFLRNLKKMPRKRTSIGRTRIFLFEFCNEQRNFSKRNELFNNDTRIRSLEDQKEAMEIQYSWIFPWIWHLQKWRTSRKVWRKCKCSKTSWYFFFE